MKAHPDRLAALLGPWAVGDGPLYELLAGAIEAAMDRGELAGGTVLPTERELARRLAVSRTTVVAAYGELKAGGRVGSRQGRGTWVAGPPAPPQSSERPFSAELYGGILGPQPGIIELTDDCPPAAPMITEALSRISPEELARDVTAAGTGYLP